MADPTNCRAMNSFFKLKDIASYSNGITELTVFGHTDFDNIYFGLESYSYCCVFIGK